MQWLYAKIAHWTQDEKQNVKPLQDWLHTASTRIELQDESLGSALQRKWRLFVYKTDKSFQWASIRLDNVFKPWHLPRNVASSEKQDTMHQITSITEDMVLVLS